MLTKSSVNAALPAQDLDRAKAFYADKLGLQPYDDDGNNVRYRMADGSEFNVFRTSGAPSGTHTQMAFDVDDVVAEVADLRNRGVTFEEYDLPGLKTDRGIASVGGDKAAWLKDSEGNVIAVVQRARVAAGQRA